MNTTQVDPRDPVLRIEKLLDPGSCQQLTENNKCGMVAATGNVAGNKVIVFASDATVKSGALGIDGFRQVVESRNSLLYLDLLQVVVLMDRHLQMLLC